jgi:hypothetical protein
MTYQEMLRALANAKPASFATKSAEVSLEQLRATNPPIRFRYLEKELNSVADILATFVKDLRGRCAALEARIAELERRGGQ